MKDFIKVKVHKFIIILNIYFLFIFCLLIFLNTDKRQQLISVLLVFKIKNRKNNTIQNRNFYK